MTRSRTVSAPPGSTSSGGHWMTPQSPGKPFLQICCIEILFFICCFEVSTFLLASQADYQHVLVHQLGAVDLVHLVLVSRVKKVVLEVGHGGL